MRAYARTYVRIAYSVVTKYAAIAHQIRHSQVLPGNPHSSAGAYGRLKACLLLSIFRSSTSFSLPVNKVFQGLFVQVVNSVSCQ